MLAIRLRRSALYVPGSNARALEKAATLPADAVVFDLEDAVAPEAKERARRAVREAVQGRGQRRGYGRKEVVVRINGLETPWGLDDLHAALEAQPDAILIPKVSGPEILQEVERHLREKCAPEGMNLWAMIETPQAVLTVQAIAKATPRLSCLVMGLNDLAAITRTRLTPDRAAFIPWFMTALAAARANDLHILDSVYNVFADDEGLALECEQARAWGFDGKTLVHPRQIETANRIFSPSPQEEQDALAVVEAFERPENQVAGVISINGRMVERLHERMARRTLELAEAAEQDRTVTTADSAPKD